MQNITTVNILKAFSGQLDPLDMVLPGLLAGSVGSIVAPGSTGKGFLANGLCATLTCKDMLGFGITPHDCQVAYITAEDPTSILEHRIMHLGTFLSPEERINFINRVTILSLTGFQPSLLTPQGRNEIWIEWLKKQCSGKRLVIIDTLRRFHQAEENDSGAMTYLIQILEEIAKETGCAIIFTHHTKKGATFSGQGGETGASRGSTALSYNVRWQINMCAMTADEAKTFGIDEDQRRRFVRVVGPKVNYSDKGLEGWLIRGVGGVLVKADLNPHSQKNINNLYGGK